ncbi:flavin-containing monooxygenase [Nocardia ninae]|nr:NAD(P)/FAD-dependent oxidoreductase [Nocardia ninae]
MNPAITAADDELRAFLDHAELPAMLMTVAHLTGDLSVLRDDLRAPGWLFAPQGGLTDAQQAQAREVAFAALRRLRDEGLPAAPPDRALLRAITTWAMGSDTSDLIGLLTEEIALPEHDPKAPRWTAGAAASPFSVAIVGAGFSGLLAAYRLAQTGVDFVIYEKNPEVGGTWFENSYPGCRTDVASHLYNYSFAPKPDWPEHFCTRDVVLNYLRDFANEHGLTEHIRFATDVREMAWDDREMVWQLTTRDPDGNETVRHNAVISAVGQLNRPRLPDIPGRDEFAGPAFHSATWDHSVDLTGARVAVIGTGASAYQLVPALAGTPAEITVFQRNPPWLRPTPHYHDTMSEGAQWLFAQVPYYLQWYRFWLFAPGLRGILEGWIVDEDYPPSEHAVSARNEELRASLWQAMQAQLADAPELVDKVIPRYPVGAKRVLRDNGRWLATLKRPDVRLVCDPIERITPAGVIANGTEFDADVIIYATGFRASEFLLPMRVTGQSGVDLHEMWNGQSRAYLGITVPQFPNLFCLYGPNTNLVGQGGSIVYFSECGTTYILDAIRLLLANGKRALTVRKDVHDAYNARVDNGNRNRAWQRTTVGGWYNENGRSAVNWPFTAREYWSRTKRVNPADYDLC